MGFIHPSVGGTVETGELSVKWATYVVDPSGDGDYTDIQSAIDALSDAGGRIFVKKGTYDLGTTGITVNAAHNGLHIVGESQDDTIIEYDGTASAVTVGDNSADTRYFKIENFTFKDTTGSAVGGLRLNRVKNSFVSFLKFEDFNNTSDARGLWLNGDGSYTGDNFIYGIKTQTCQEGIALTDTCNANHFHGGVIRTTKGNANATGVSIDAPGTGNTITGFTIESNYTGLKLDGNKNSISNVYFEDNTLAIDINGEDNVLTGMQDVASNTTFIDDAATNSTYILGNNGPHVFGEDVTIKNDIFLIDSPSNARARLDRASTSNSGSIQYYTAGSVQWSIEQPNDTTQNLRIRDNVNGANILTAEQGATPTITADGNWEFSNQIGGTGGKRSAQVEVFDPTTDVATGDGKKYITIPSTLNGMNLVRAQATVVTAGTTNATTVMVHNVTQTADMLSGAISIASGGTTGTVGTIDTSNDDVATDDVLRIDVDSVSTTAPQGLTVVLEFQLP